MRKAGHRRVAAVLAVPALALSACSDTDEEPAGLSGTSPTPEETAPVPTTPPAEPSPAPSSDPGLSLDLPRGLEIDELPEVSGAELAALETYLKFEIEYWRSLLDSEVSSEISRLAVDEVADQVADQVDVQVDDGFHLGGTLRIEPAVEGATSELAVVSACLDQSEVTVVRGGAEEISSDSEANPTFAATADLAFRGDGWRITEYRMDMESC